jgi:hypothetical protein
VKRFSKSPSGGKRPGTAAFTMVELALCIGIIAFAMVAIMGVLPLGLNVQKQNREDTIIDQEGPQWISILKSGQSGWGELTNYLDFIAIEHTPLGVAGGVQKYRFTGPFLRPPPDDSIATTEQLLSLLSIPKYEADSGSVFSNRVTAVFRSLSGSQDGQILTAGKVGAQPDEQKLDSAFRYQLEVELVPVSPTPTLDMGDVNPVYTNLNTLENIRMGGFLNAYRLDPNSVIDLIRSPSENRPDRDVMAGTLYDLRLTFRWPVFKIGEEYQLGPGSRTFRTQLNGRPLFSLYTNNTPATVYWPGTQLRPRRFDASVINSELTF